jgi:carboxypeptidase Taq
MSRAARSAYEELAARLRERALLLSSKAVLEWDEETCLPPSGIAHRSRQIAQLAGMTHELLVAPRTGELLARALSEPLGRPHSAEAVNLREWSRLHGRNQRLERALVEESAQVVSMAQHAWAEARRVKDFGLFRPHLERVLDVKRREAQALADGELYDALLEEFEPGMRAARLAALFTSLRPELLALLERIRGALRQPPPRLLERRVPVEAQRRLCQRLARGLGYDFNAGRLDTSAHPFSTHLGPGDSRITARFFVEDVCEGLFGTLHETGHALYDQGLPVEHFGTPRGEPASYSVHESQSRLWENFVGRGLGFWRYAWPLLREEWAGHFEGVSLEDFHFAINRVGPSLNRVRADEVTYNLHIFIRFELERALLTGALAAADLPEAWNAAYRDQLGLVPPDDAEGCLQDGHWGAGLFGYFPTYSLGNMLAAQLHAAATRELGDLEEPFARGDFTGLLSWLRSRVHAHGQTFWADALVQEVTGSPLSHQWLVEALTRKYSALYGL